MLACISPGRLGKFVRLAPFSYATASPEQICLGVNTKHGIRGFTSIELKRTLLLLTNPFVSMFCILSECPIESSQTKTLFLFWPKNCMVPETRFFLRSSKADKSKMNCPLSVQPNNTSSGFLAGISFRHVSWPLLEEAIY